MSSTTHADVQPGEKITFKNADKIVGIAPEGIVWCVRNGMDIDIVPYEKVPIPADYTAATEKYSGQVQLSKDRALVNWVAGKPFPNIDNNDPEAATKIMYNFERTHYFSETLYLNLTDADTGSLHRGADNVPTYAVERHFIPEWLRILRFQGRLKNDPKPEILPNADQVFYKAGLYPLIEPFDLKGVGGVSFRYLDPKKNDDTWLYLPQLRRVRRLSTAQRSDALFGQDIDIDSFGGYAGQIPWFEWKLLGEKPMLASMHGQRLPPEPCKGDGGMTFCEPWEMRPCGLRGRGQAADGELRVLETHHLRRQRNQSHPHFRSLRLQRRALEKRADQLSRRSASPIRKSTSPTTTYGSSPTRTRWSTSSSSTARGSRSPGSRSRTKPAGTWISGPRPRAPSAKNGSRCRA